MVVIIQIGKSKQRGFSLIELMTVVVIIAILAGFAAPSFSEMIKTQRVRAAAVDLYADLTLARSEAIKRGVQVSVVPTDTATPKDWAKGWNIVLTSSPTTIVRAQDFVEGEVSALGPANIVFGSAGRPGAIASIEIKHVDIASSKWRCVTIDLAGRPVSKAGGCS